MWRVSFRCAFALLCAAAAWVPVRAVPQGRSPVRFAEWPQEWEGRELVRLPLSDEEQRFNRGFPGAIAKFTDGEREFLFRQMNEGTRRAHSSSECFRGLGFEVISRGVMRDERGAKWSVYDVRRRGEQLRLRERISDQNGNEWSDFSSWYWGTLAETATGPWLAVTVVDRLTRPKL